MGGTGNATHRELTKTTTWFSLLHMCLAFTLAMLAAAGMSGAAQDQPSQSPQPPVRYVEREVWIPAPNAFPRGLDSIEVYADRPGRRPLVVLTHGTSSDPVARSRVTPWSQLNQALWFARRGFVVIVVVRSGYGKSSGQMDTQHGGCSSRREGSFGESGEASAEDLRAAIRYANSLPQVDGNTVLSAGVSTGGFAQVALIADPPKGLKAAISFAGGRGGDGHEHNCDVYGLAGAFAAFGRKAHSHGDLPMLWIYAENDHWFPPAMAHQFEAAYSKGGGNEQLVMAPPDGDDGHHLYGHVEAWSDIVESFLKAHSLLPLGNEVLPGPAVPDVPPPPGLLDKGLVAWRHYLLAAPFKAFASNEQGAWGFSQARFDQDLADAEALDKCRKAAAGNHSCTITAKTPGAK
jgi:dienelactone hydrolase